jgi:glycosyltransferase involved in cell wall biosynthesis
MSRSGYGEQARFALRSIRSRSDLFDIYISNIRWGATGQTAATKEEETFIKETLRKTQLYIDQGGQFDISLQITVPNEFENMAGLNVGYTAGVETTKVAPEWIAKTNESMHRVITTSTHAKNVLEQTRYDVKDPQGNEIKGWGVQVPVAAVNYPIRKYTAEPTAIEFTTSNNFLVVAQWGPRKNLENTIRWFVDVFRDNEDIGLVVKTNTVSDSITDREVTSGRMQALLNSCGDRKCKIYLVHGELPDTSLAWLYEHPTMKAIINIGHGEGFGLPLFEAACHGLPIITAAWSGQTDFIYSLSKKGKRMPRFIKVDYDINTVQKEAVWPGIIQEDARWCYVREASYKRALTECLEKEAHHRKNAQILQDHVLTTFTPENQYEEFIKGMGLPAGGARDDDNNWLLEIEDIIKDYE